MLRDDLRIPLTVWTPFHIGNGSSRSENASEQSSMEVRLLQRAASSAPWLPGSSVKGALKAIAKANQFETVSDLFGVGGASGNSAVGGRRACLTVFGAPASCASEFAERCNAMHAGTGTSKKNYLFAREMLDIGSEFIVRLRLETPSHEVREKLLADTLRLLSFFATPNGYALGSSKSANFGRVKLASTVVECQSFVFKAEGWFDQGSVDLEIQPHKIKKDVISLICPGPYLAKEGERVEKRDGVDANGKQLEKKVIFPSRAPARKDDGIVVEKEHVPRLAGSGVKGVLRARAEWLVALMVLRGDTVQSVEVQTSAGTRNLNVVQRVFGDEGYRARLDLCVNNATRKGVSRHPSIRIDPITQAPYDGALFEIEADFGVSFDLDFSWFKKPRPDEEALVNALKEDINANGLKLGMATTKGFGWFNCDHPGKSETAVLSEALQKRLTAATHDLEPRKKKLERDLKDQLPHEATTVPYRLLETDLESVTMPEPEVVDAWRQTGLHSDPMQEGLSGTIDLDWVFETPVLIGNGLLPVREPQCLRFEGRNEYYIPGSSLKGYLRSLLVAALNTRLTHLNAVQLSKEERGQGRTTFELEDPLRHITRPSTQGDENPHRPRLDDSFTPDFVQALFGYVQEADDKIPDGIDHAKAHLKSRVSFGFASLVSDAQPGPMIETTFAPPKGTAAFYDHIGVKTYVPGKVGPITARNRLLPADAGTKKMPTKVRFLEPQGQTKNLIFRGRIAFHNLTSVELGALYWALLIQANVNHRHQIGGAKPFGYGQCFCANLDLQLDRNDGADVSDVSEKLKTHFTASGHDFAPHYGAFATFMNAAGRHSKNADIGKAFLLGFDPAYGSLLRERSGVEQGSVGYQTGAMFDSRVTQQGQEETQDFINRKVWSSHQKMALARKTNGPSGSGHGRLAALLRNKP